MNIGKSIKRQLVDMGWSQKHLASLLGIGANSMSRLAKTPDCSSARLRRLAEIFGMKVSEFVALGEDGAPVSVAASISALRSLPEVSIRWAAVDMTSFPGLSHGDWVKAKNGPDPENFDAQYQRSDDEYWWLGRDGKEVVVTHYR